MRKRILLTALAIFTLIPTTQLKAQDTPPKLLMPWKFYESLAQCETSGNWQHSTLSYTGGFGIYRRTWQRYSNHTSAKNHTPEEQARVVDRIAFRGWTDRHGKYNFPVGPWGWGSIKRQNCNNLQGYICKSHKKMVRYWRRNC